MYLAERNGWKELYPEDPQQRAKIHQYLHWHHSNARLATTQVIRPLAMQMWGMATPEMLTKTEPERMEKTLTSIVEFVETFLAMPFIALTRQPTIADFACYCELDQIEAMDLFDFSKYPKTADWMQRMKVRRQLLQLERDITLTGSARRRSRTTTRSARTFAGSSPR